MFQKEKIYIAGPECFFENGSAVLQAMKKRAEAFGFGVTLPNDHPLDMGNPNLQKRADSIFADLEVVMNETTVIIADLEAYRGAEADSGTIYEIGMAYAKGAKCYGYTRDKRPLAWKDQKYRLEQGVVLDEHGKVAPYMNLPYSPCVIGSTKIIEGDFDDCLKMLMTDIEEEEKQKALKPARHEAQVQEPLRVERDRPLVYLSGPERYDAEAVEVYHKMKEFCAAHGLDACTPIDWNPGIKKLSDGSEYALAANQFNNAQQHVRNCDAVIANLNDYRGYECSNDTGFECGMGFQLGKKLYGYMESTVRMRDRVPNYGEEKEFREFTGCNVENFDYPLNLMFGCSMKIFEGEFEDVIEKIAADLLKKAE